jgi:predicted ATPase
MTTPATDLPLEAANLSTPLMPSVGRDRELATITATLGLGDQRLLTLTGPGGVGKTRLALAAADAAEDFPDGKWFVGLAALADFGLVASAIARVLNVPEAGDAPLADRLAARPR